MSAKGERGVTGMNMIKAITNIEPYNCLLDFCKLQSQCPLRPLAIKMVSRTGTKDARKVTMSSLLGFKSIFRRRLTVAPL